MIRVLQIFHEMENGGTTHFIMNYYRHIDRSRIQFDFLTSVTSPGYFDDEIQSLGGKLWHASPFERNPVRNYHDIARIVRENKYKIVHRHTGSAFGYYDLRAAKSGGAEQLIIHSHNTEAGKPIVHRIAKEILKTDCHRLACSKAAEKFLFGEEHFELIKNAIEVEKFEFQEGSRNQMRRQLGLGNSFVVGHIGRMDRQKNPLRLLEIFHEIHSRRPNSILISAGSGSMMNEAKQYAAQLGIKEAVRFLGTQNDVNKLYQTFDVFLFPSFFEGLPLTLIEAQANGLRCITSKDMVSPEVNVTGNVTFLSLNETNDKWADTVLNGSLSRDPDATKNVRAAGYDVVVEAHKLTDYYLALQNS